MNNLDSVMEIIHLSIMTEINEDRKEDLYNWLTNLKDDRFIDGNRFLINLAIDLKNSSIDSYTILKLLNDMNYDVIPEKNLSQFDSLLHHNTLKYFKHSNSCDTDFPKIKYATVISWEKLLSQIPDDFLVRPYDLQDSHMLYDKMFKEFTLTLKDIKHWPGGKNLTWVLPIEDFDEVVNENNSVSFILDCLGIDKEVYRDPEEILDKHFVIEYPDDFSIQCYQPTILCGNWNRKFGLYLSYRKLDGFGRTYTVSGYGKLNARERVFSSENYANENYKIREIGTYEGNLIKDTNTANIILEALKRFKDG